MAFLNEEMAKYILKLLEKIKTMQFKAKMITRRNHFVVYIKNRIKSLILLLISERLIHV